MSLQRNVGHSPPTALDLRSTPSVHEVKPSQGSSESVNTCTGAYN